MKIKRLLMTFGLLVLTLFAIAACGQTKSSFEVDTILTADTSFSGSRQIQIKVPSGLYKTIFDKNIENMQNVLADRCPEGVTFSCSSDDGKSALINISIAFKSWKDYRKTVQAVNSASNQKTDIKPVVIYEYSRSILKNGYKLEENFNSRDLLGWVYDAFLDAYPKLADANMEDVFDLADTQVVYDGQTTDLSDTDIILISDLTSNAFDSVQVYVDFEDDENFNTTITYTVSNQVVNLLGVKLDDLMNGLVPSEGYLEYSENGNERKYQVSFMSDSIDSFKTSMNKALCTSNTVFSISQQGDTDSLSAKKTITALFDAAYFLDFTKEESRLTYVFDMSQEYTIDSLTGVYGYLDSVNTSYNSDGCKITTVLKNSDEISMVLAFAVDIDSASIKTSVISEENLKREVSLKLSNDADYLIGSGISERLDLLKETYPEEGKVIVEKNEMITYVSYDVTFNAESCEELTEMTRVLFEEEGSDSNTAKSIITGGRVKKENPLTVGYSYEDTLNLSEFLRGSQIKNGITYSIVYPKRYKASFKEESLYENAVIDGASISCVTYDKILTVKTNGSKKNMIGISVIIAAILSAIVFIIIILLNISHIIFFIKNRRLDFEGYKAFERKNMLMITCGSVSFVVLIFNIIRLLFKIY